MKHYVYKIFDDETEQYYYGSRSCEVEPEYDEYMGSMKSWKPEDDTRLLKEIIKDDFETREEAIEFESMIINENIDDELNENYHIPNEGFHTHGITYSEEYKKAISKYRIERELAKGSNNPMYNKEHSNETIKKMKEKAKGRWTLEWFIDKYGKDKGKILYDKKRKEHSEKMTGREGLKGEDNPLYGKPRPECVKEKISKTKSNKILQFSMDDIFIKEWDSVKEAASYYNMHVNSIYHNLKNRRPHANGYLWRYK